MKYKVEVCDLSLVIKGHTILEHISLDLKPGKIYGLIGRNGSGKTILMKCICGFMHVSGGTVKVDGKVIGKDCDFPADTALVCGSGWDWHRQLWKIPLF